MEIAVKPKIPEYMPQINAAPDGDDPDTYMMLVPAAKKRPILQIVFVVLGIICLIVALGVDEMSDGDVRFVEPEDTTYSTSYSSNEFLEEVDYDCGWNSFKLKFIYYEQQHGYDHFAYEKYTYKYTSTFCKDYDEFVDPDFCEDSEANGKV